MTEPQPTQRRAPQPLQAAAAKLAQSAMLLTVLLAGLSLVSVWQTAMSVVGMDFYQYWITPQVIRNGRLADIYSQSGRQAIYQAGAAKAGGYVSLRERTAAEVWGKNGQQSVEVTASPLAYTFFDLFASGDYERDYRRFVLANLLALALSVTLLGRLAGWRFPASLLMLAVLCVSFQPLLSNTRVGNVNALQAAFLAIFLFLATRRQRYANVLAGAILALVVLTKPNLLLSAAAVVVVQLFNRRLAKVGLLLLGGAIGIAIGLGMSSAFFGGMQCWTQWLSILPTLLSVHTVAQGNQGLARVLLEACGADLSWMILAVSGLAFIVVAWLGRQKGESLVDESAPAGDRSETAQLILAVGIGAAIAVLGARLTWLHYYFLMLPLLVYVLRPLPQQMRPVAALVHRLSGVIVLLAMSNLVVVAVYSTTAHAWVLSAGATMLLALGLWDLLPTASPTLPGSRPGL